MMITKEFTSKNEIRATHKTIKDIETTFSNQLRKETGVPVEVTIRNENNLTISVANKDEAIAKKAKLAAQFLENNNLAVIDEEIFYTPEPEDIEFGFGDYEMYIYMTMN